jgi:hypothetical protein
MSYTYKITGKLEPENLIDSLNIQNNVMIKHEEFNVEGFVEMKIVNSEILITYKSEIDHTDENSPNIQSLRNILMEQVTLVINIIGYVDSIYLDVYLFHIECKKLNLNERFITKGEYNVNKTIQEAISEFNKIYHLFDDNKQNRFIWIKDVFADFHYSIKYPAQTAHYCYRAIETIRNQYYDDNHLKQKGERIKDGWEKLNKDLNYIESDYQHVIEFGLPNRHGRYPAITYKQREAIMNFTRQLIDRFIAKRLEF